MNDIQGNVVITKGAIFAITIALLVPSILGIGHYFTNIEKQENIISQLMKMDDRYKQQFVKIEKRIDLQEKRNETLIRMEERLRVQSEFMKTITEFIKNMQLDLNKVKTTQSEVKVEIHQLHLLLSKDK